jgi:hypothetical protein
VRRRRIDPQIAALGHVHDLSHGVIGCDVDGVGRRCDRHVVQRKRFPMSGLVGIEGPERDGGRDRCPVTLGQFDVDHADLPAPLAHGGGDPDRSRVWGGEVTGAHRDRLL